MEKEIIIDTNDEHRIYGYLTTPSEKADRLVIFVHGFTGNCNEHIFFNGSKYMAKQGIASFRFDLYSWKEKGRTFTDCDAQIHLDDLKSVYNQFKDQFSKIYLVGHSFGGIIVQLFTKPVSGVILWDGSHPADFIDQAEYKYVESLDSYTVNWGNVFVIGRKMHDDKWLKMTAKEIVDCVKSPIKIICAGNGILKEYGKEYFELANEPKEYTVIEGAGHTFDEEGVEEKLFEQTASWVLKN